MPVDQRPALLDAYLSQFGRYPNVARTFEALPDPADHPTFRLSPPGTDSHEINR